MTANRHTEPTFFQRGLASFGVNMCSAAILFGLNVLLARTMGEDSFGIYILVVTWVMVLALVGKAGFDTALVRFVAVYVETKAWNLLRGILRLSFQVCLGISILLTIVLIMFSTVFLDELGTELATALKIGALIIPVLSIVHVVQAALRGLKRVPRNELPDRIVRPVLMLIVVGYLVSADQRTLGSDEGLYLHLVCLLIGGLLAVLWLRNALPAECSDASNAFESKLWMATALPLAAFSATHLLLANIDILMVGSLIGAKQAGVYAVATKAALFTTFALTAVNAIAAPTIAEMHEKGDYVGLQAMLTKYARINAAFAAMVAGSLFLLGEFVLGWFGAPFVTGYTAMLILCGGHFINASTGSIGFLLTMTGHERQALMVMLATVAANLILNALLIPVWGLTGAAISTALSTMLWNVALWAYAVRKLKLNSSIINVTI